MKMTFLCCMAALFLGSCNKAIDDLIEKQFLSNKYSDGFTLYTIRKGDHYANNNSYKPVELSELQFIVRFDSSAIYQTKEGHNQYDINKLYGFSDNSAEHHQYSARFGWSWNNNALRLYAYVYNDGKISKTELGPVSIGEETRCGIKVAGDHYLFTVNDMEVGVPRSSNTALAKGYMLYPYFGGDEPAPQEIRIWIKNL